MNSQRKINGARRRGVSMVYVVLLLPVLLGIAAYCIDLSWLYARQAKAQTAADAAALAGAWQHANFNSAQADAWARYYAALSDNGGYTNGVGGATVTVQYPALDTEVTPNVTRPNWYRVTVQRAEPTFFARIFGSRFATVPVGATATALYETLAEFDIKGKGTYGVAPGPVNLSLFGPDGYYNNGDCYSVRRLTNGSWNPLNTNAAGVQTWQGYDFTMNLGGAFANKDTVYFQIFDPDTYNKNNGVNADGANAIDELRNEQGNPGDSSDATTTKYSLYYDKGTSDTRDDELVSSTAQKSYGYADGPTTDMLWTDFFSIRKRDLATNKGNLRLNVISTAGSSENGFDLRINNKAALSKADQDADRDNFDPANGTSIKAQGHLPMNFNQSGSITVNLGTVPVQAAGGQLNIRKFDTDVGATSITYRCSTLPNTTFPAGVLSTNGAFATDTLQVPTSYTTEGIWTATYNAGVGDTSVWDMSYSNYGPGKPGGIRLIR